MTVGEIKTALKKFGFNDSDPLLIWINASMHLIEDAYANWSWLQTLESVVQTANDSTFTPAGGVTRVITLKDVTSGGYPDELIYWDNRKWEREISKEEDQGDPWVYTIFGAKDIQVYPTPTTAKTYRLKYIKALADLVNDADVPVVPTKNHYLIVLGAAFIALQAENEEDRAANAQAQFDTGLDRMVLADMKRQIGEPSMVEDTAYYGSD